MISRCHHLCQAALQGLSATAAALVWPRLAPPGHQLRLRTRSLFSRPSLATSECSCPLRQLWVASGHPKSLSEPSQGPAAVSLSPEG